MQILRINQQTLKINTRYNKHPLRWPWGANLVSSHPSTNLSRIKLITTTLILMAKRKVISNRLWLRKFYPSYRPLKTGGSRSTTSNSMKSWDNNSPNQIALWLKLIWASYLRQMLSLFWSSCSFISKSISKSSMTKRHKNLCRLKSGTFTSKRLVRALLAQWSKLSIHVRPAKKSSQSLSRPTVLSETQVIRSKTHPTLWLSKNCFTTVVMSSESSPL